MHFYFIPARFQLCFRCISKHFLFIVVNGSFYGFKFSLVRLSAKIDASTSPIFTPDLQTAALNALHLQLALSKRRLFFQGLSNESFLVGSPTKDEPLIVRSCFFILCDFVFLKFLLFWNSGFKVGQLFVFRLLAFDIHL